MPGQPLLHLNDFNTFIMAEIFMGQSSHSVGRGTYTQNYKQQDYKEKLVGHVLPNKVCETTWQNTDEKRIQSRVNDPFRMGMDLTVDEWAKLGESE